MINRKVLVVTHADLADGIRSSIHFFIGEQIEVTSICAFTKVNNVQEVLEEYFSNTPETDEVICFSDILFGSVNQWLGIYRNRPHTHIITGVNLGLILAVLLKPADEYLTEEEIVSAVNEAAASIIYVNNLKVETSDDDE